MGSKKKVVVNTNNEVVGSVQLYENGNSINIETIRAGGKVTIQQSTISIGNSKIDKYDPNEINIVSNNAVYIQPPYGSDESLEEYTVDENGNVIIIQQNTIRKH